MKSSKASRALNVSDIKTVQKPVTAEAFRQAQLNMIEAKERAALPQDRSKMTIEQLREKACESMKVTALKNTGCRIVIRLGQAVLPSVDDQSHKALVAAGKQDSQIPKSMDVENSAVEGIMTQWKASIRAGDYDTVLRLTNDRAVEITKKVAESRRINAAKLKENKAKFDQSAPLEDFTSEGAAVAEATTLVDELTEQFS